MKKKSSKVMPFLMAFVMLFALAVPIAAAERLETENEVRIVNPILDRIGQDGFADVDAAQVERMVSTLMGQDAATFDNVDAIAAHQAEIDRLLAVIDELGIDNLQDLAPFLTAMAFGADCEILSALSCVYYHLIVPVIIQEWEYIGGGWWRLVREFPGWVCVMCGALFYD